MTYVQMIASISQLVTDSAANAVVRTGAMNNACAYTAPEADEYIHCLTQWLVIRKTRKYIMYCTVVRGDSHCHR